MLPLKYPRVWLGLGWLLLILVMAGSVVPVIVVKGFSAADKLVHGGSYLILVTWFAGLYRRQRHVFIALALFALGLVLEVIQGQLPYRGFDPFDLLANAVGILLGLILAQSVLVAWCQRLEGFFLAANSSS